MRGRSLWFSLLVVLLGGVAHGQTTRPSTAGERWELKVQTLATALADSNASALMELVGENTPVSAFDGRPADAIRLLTSTAGGCLVMSRGYASIPVDLAKDISGTFAAASADVPEETRKFMLVGNEAQARVANQTARQWLTEMLAARETDPVGVIAFWCRRNSSSSSSRTDAEVVFVLVRGETTLDEYRIASIAFGKAAARR